MKLRKKGYDHFTLMEVLKENGFDVNTDSGDFPELQDSGYIRCNDGIDNGYAYIEAYDIAPTKEQYNAIVNWVNYTLRRQQHLCSIILTQKDCIELHYMNIFSGRKIMLDIEDYYIHPKSPNAIIKTVYYEKNKIISTVNEETTIKFINVIPTQNDVKEVCRTYEIKKIPKVEMETHSNIPNFSFCGNYKEIYTAEEIRTKTCVIKKDATAIKRLLISELVNALRRIIDTLGQSKTGGNNE